MYIDFHTHIFPDKIAAPAVSKLRSILHEQGIDDTAYTDATSDGIIGSMKKNGIDHSVILPVATVPKQFESINRFSAELNGKEGIISFGAIHPDNDAPEEKLEMIKSMGMKGIKLHPDYQNVFINDERFVRIIDHALFLGLTVVIHSGYDPLSPDVVHCDTARAADMLEKVKHNITRGNVVLAHLGTYGNRGYDGDFERLDPYGVYYDTSMVLDEVPSELLADFFRKRGTDKILFATDSPWKDQGKFKAVLENLPLTDEEKGMIAYKNAAELLSLDI